MEACCTIFYCCNRTCSLTSLWLAKLVYVRAKSQPNCKLLYIQSAHEVVSSVN